MNKRADLTFSPTGRRAQSFRPAVQGIAPRTAEGRLIRHALCAACRRQIQGDTKPLLGL